MDIKKWMLSMGVIGMTVAAAPASLAAGPGWYLGAGGGSTDLKGGAEAVDPDIASEGAVIDLDDEDTGWKVFGGYRFNQNLALEGIYVDFGKFSVNHVSGTGTELDEVRPDAFCLDGVGTLPVGNNFSVLGKIGVCRWNDHPRESGTPGYVPDVESSDGTDLTYGLGAGYDFNNNWGMRAEWERYTNVVHDKGDVDLLSLSVLYRF